MLGEKRRIPLKAIPDYLELYLHTEEIVCKRWNDIQEERFSKIKDLPIILVTLKNGHSWQTGLCPAFIVSCDAPRPGISNTVLAEWSLGRVEGPDLAVYLAWVGKMWLTFICYIGVKRLDSQGRQATFKSQPCPLPEGWCWKNSLTVLDVNLLLYGRKMTKQLIN